MDQMTKQIKKAELVISARWIATISGGVLEHSSVVIDDGKIIDVLPDDRVDELYTAGTRINLPEHVLMPGLINLHTHAAMSLMRGFADDLPLMIWLQNHIWPAEKQALSERFVRDGTLLGCAEMLAGGVTCFSDMYFYPQAAAEAVIQSGMRANLGLVVLEFPTAYASDADDYLLKGLEARDTWRSNPLLTTSLAPHAPYTVEDRSFEKILTYADQLGLGIHTHLHETSGEISQSLDKYGVRPIQRLANLGVLGPSLVAAHCVHLEQREMEMLAEFGCHVAHCQTSNLKLASGIAPIVDLLQRGIGIGIGTDGAASNNRLDLFAEMRLAALVAKGSSGDATALPARKALEMATIDAARALGLDDKIGTVEVGKFADLTAVRMADPELLPCFDPISQLVYVAGREHVTHTWVAGELRYQKLKGQDGIYANIEPLELKEIITVWHSRLARHK
ncbi:MAG: N-ethylammeline chlorohydrolase [Betaproteobacteria bacterium HGW-Betaproteobacteria-8]|nr:MAG: N-ethylammeline chlorohydrolase [Betaproteobacteria bacterium HGW-Betaproteobacteria-8]